MGHLAGRYDAAFNLTTNQRSIMVLNVMLISWIGAGGILFARLIDIPFADGIYFVVVTITTIGLGDIVPTDNLFRALVLPYALIGVLLLGLIIATIRSMVLDPGRDALLIHRTERRRLKHFRMFSKSDEVMPSSDVFQLMRRLHRKAVKRGDLVSLTISISSATIFLLFGALIFKESEGWSYFHGVYFCMLCLLTIGYGDFAPRSSAGRSFFVVWGLAAVPLMTILISNLSDTLFKRLLEIGNNLAEKLLHLKNNSDPSLTVNTTDNDNPEPERVFQNLIPQRTGKYSTCSQYAKR